MSTDPDPELLHYEVFVQHTKTYRTRVQARGPGEAATMVGDKLRADDTADLEVVHGVINDISVHRRNAPAVQ